MFFQTRQQARNYARSTGRRVSDCGSGSVSGRRWVVRLSSAQA